MKRKHNNRSFWALALMLAAMLASGLPSAIAESTPEVSKYGKVYKGSEGEIVELTRLGDAANGEFLVRLSRIDHPLDGQVIKLKSSPAGNGLDYSYDAEDGRHNLISERGSASSKSYQLYLGSKAIDLIYDEEFSKESLPQHILTQYLEQERLAKLKQRN